jgi:hypothetical protein
MDYGLKRHATICIPFLTDLETPEVILGSARPTELNRFLFVLKDFTTHTSMGLWCGG